MSVIVPMVAVPNGSLGHEHHGEHTEYQRLDQANIFVWNGNFYALAVTKRLGLEDRGGLLRVGLAHYNTAEEVETLLGVLEDMPR